MKQTGWRRLAKRALDLGAASIGLVVAAPILGATAIAVRRSMGSPVLFRQQRPGHNGQPFELLKFRTMRDAVGPDGRPLPDEERVTRVGSFIRSTSLDELPQLINVLRGELSLVGPRPLLMQYMNRYSPEQARRHDVLPGITGWAQTHGRNAISWPEKLAHDVWYVDNWSLLLDLHILALTVVRVLARSDISRDGHVTTPEFRGETSVAN